MQSNYEVLKTWKEAKVPALKILQSMTIDAAELMGVESTVGRIEIGFDANIVAFNSNPLEDIENILG